MIPAAGAQRRAHRPLCRLLAVMGWDLRLQVRHHILTVTVIVTLLYVILFRAVPAARSDTALVVLLFSDPSMLGFLFIGVLVLFERGSNTLQAVVVTPLSSSEYLWAKALSLTAIAVPSGFAMAWAGHGPGFNPFALLAALVLTSLLFVFLGFVGVARVVSVNEYLLIVPVFFAPMMLPLLNFAGVTDSLLLYAIPSQASLILFEAAFAPQPAEEIVYALGFLLASMAVFFAWARRSFELFVRAPGRGR